MDRFEMANLIRIFDFYLALMFLVGLVRRWTVYRDTFLLVVSHGRWPKLLERIHEHKGLLLNISTMRPAALALGLMLTQIVASRMIWPQATLRVRNSAVRPSSFLILPSGPGRWALDVGR